MARQQLTTGTFPTRQNPRHTKRQRRTENGAHTFRTHRSHSRRDTPRERYGDRSQQQPGTASRQALPAHTPHETQRHQSPAGAPRELGSYLRQRGQGPEPRPRPPTPPADPGGWPRPSSCWALLVSSLERKQYCLGCPWSGQAATSPSLGGRKDTLCPPSRVSSRLGTELALQRPLRHCWQSEAPGRAGLSNFQGPQGAALGSAHADGVLPSSESRGHTMWSHTLPSRRWDHQFMERQR